MRLREQKYFDKPNDGGGASGAAGAVSGDKSGTAGAQAGASAAGGSASADPAAGGAAAAVAGEAKPGTAAESGAGAAAGGAGTPKPDWKDARIAKLTHDLNAEREARRASAATPAPAQGSGESDAAFQARVDTVASQKAVQIAAQADWDRQCNSVAEQGQKEFADFGARLGAITSTVNGQDPAEVAAYNDFIAAAIETGQAHKVLYALGSDPGEYQRLSRLSPVKRAMELGVMASKLVSDKDPSGLPKPLTPIGSAGDHYEGIRPDDPKRGTKIPLKEWMKQREAQAKERGIQ